MELFPMFLKLEGRRCLVVGAGAVAESKVTSLLRCGADVRVVAPEATAKIQAAAKAGKLAWQRRRFRTSDLAGAYLVVAATSSPTLHEQIFRRAHREGILCNCVDEPSRCDFYYPAVVRRGPLQIAISTSGQAPALAQRLRKKLARQFGPECAEWTEEIGQKRSELLPKGTPMDKRRKTMRKLIGQRAFANFGTRLQNAKRKRRHHD